MTEPMRLVIPVGTVQTLVINLTAELVAMLLTEMDHVCTRAAVVGTRLRYMRLDVASRRIPACVWVLLLDILTGLDAEHSNADVQLPQVVI